MESLWIPSSSSALHGQHPIMINGVETTSDMPFFQPMDKEENEDDDFDGWYHPAGKKRRLTATQVQSLEKSFEVENKLEPDRKLQLAKELGLQPRQVAIWFQNRRARFKNKQLEKDYDSMKASYDKLKADYENLLKEKDNLISEVLALKDKMLTRDKGMKILESLDVALNSSLEHVPHVPLLACKQEETCSAKSDVFDSDSPYGNRSSSIEPADSSNVVFQPDQSDISQDEEDDLSKSLLHASMFPKFELDCHYDAHVDSCNFQLPVEDQSFWSSLY